MYLIIFEDGSISKSDSVGISELEAADDGILDLIDISASDSPFRYYDGEWSELDYFGEGL